MNTLVLSLMMTWNSLVSGTYCLNSDFNFAQTTDGYKIEKLNENELGILTAVTGPFHGGNAETYHFLLKSCE